MGVADDVNSLRRVDVEADEARGAGEGGAAAFRPRADNTAAELEQVEPAVDRVPERTVWPGLCSNRMACTGCAKAWIHPST